MKSNIAQMGYGPNFEDEVAAGELTLPLGNQELLSDANKPPPSLFDYLLANDAYEEPALDARPPARPVACCECGAHSAGLNLHSDWCPLKK